VGGRGGVGWGICPSKMEAKNTPSRRCTDFFVVFVIL
jgi:hypothetical protein